MARRLVDICSVALITAGAVVLLDVGLTLAWGEPLSTLRGWLAQREASEELVALEESFRPARAGSPSRRRSPGELAEALSEQTSPGEPIGRLLIPAIDLSIVAVEGTDTASLKLGPGRYPETAFPGQGETVAIAGHRTTYLAPFRRINELAAGDEITFDMPYATFTYRFDNQRIVDPSQIGVVRNVGYERLVLTACHPLYSAAQRIVVFARLVAVSRERGADGDNGTAQARSQTQLDIAPPSLGPAWAGVGGLVLIVIVGATIIVIGTPQHRRRRRPLQQ